MSKTETRAMIKQAIKDKDIKMTLAQYKKLEKLAETLPMWWARTNKDAYEHFCDGVLMGLILAKHKTKKRVL